MALLSRPCGGASFRCQNRIRVRGCSGTRCVSGASTKMRRSSFVGTMAMFLVATAPPGVMSMANAQAPGNGKAVAPSQKTGEATKVDDEPKAIDDKYDRELLQLDQRRLEALAALAATQKPDRAAITYERLFRLAIAGDLFRDAEAA